MLTTTRSRSSIINGDPLCPHSNGSTSCVRMGSWDHSKEPDGASRQLITPVAPCV